MGSTVPWPNVSGAAISKSTNNGLQALLGMTDDTKPGKPGLLAFLKSEGAANVCVTGHSLGGALSPTLALYMSDNKSAWCTDTANANVSCLPVAGATPGNAAFAAYYATQLQNTTTRVWNELDVVPHGFEYDMLQEVPTIYSSGGIDCPIDFKAAVALLEQETKNIGYTQLVATSESTVAFNNGIYAMQTDFVGQALYNHVAAYGVYFEIFDFQALVNQILNLGKPFFSDGTKMLQETALETAEASAVCKTKDPVLYVRGSMFRRELKISYTSTLHTHSAPSSAPIS